MQAENKSATFQGYIHAVFSGYGSGFGRIRDIEETTHTDDYDWITSSGKNKNISESAFPATSFSNITISAGHPLQSCSKLALYVGGGISLVSCLIALFTYTSSRKFRVKRPHMITINLCISLIIFYMGILMSVASSMDHIIGHSNHSATCVTGAVFFQLGVLYAWTWTTVHWGYLTYTVHKIAAPHISHFVIKITLPAYGLPTFLTSVIIIGNSSTTNNDYVSMQTCFFKLTVALTAVLNILYLAICFLSITACATYCVFRLICTRTRNQVESTRMRIKVSVARLAVITSGVLTTSILELVRSGVGPKYSETWFEVFNGIVLGTAGIMVAVGLTLRSKEFRLYLVKRSQSTVSLRRIMSSFHRRSNQNGKKRNSARRSNPTIDILYDVVRAPQKIPRESSRVNATPAVLAQLHASTLEDKENSEDCPEESKKTCIRTEPAATCADVQMHVSAGCGFGNEHNISVRKSSSTVTRMSSLRQRVWGQSFRNPSHTHSVQLAPIHLPTVRFTHRTQVFTDDFEKASLSSVDIYRKTSF